MNSASTRSKKLLGLAALTATGALVLTACGSGGDPMSTSATIQPTVSGSLVSAARRKK